MVRGCVHYPPLACAARLMAPMDQWLGKRILLGAAFVVAAAVKEPASLNSPPAASLDRDQRPNVLLL